MASIYRRMTPAGLPAAVVVRLSTIENAITLQGIAEDCGITPDALARAMATTVRGWLCEDSGEVLGFDVLGFALKSRGSARRS